jgi:hypothetical protein
MRVCTYLLGSLCTLCLQSQSCIFPQRMGRNYRRHLLAESHTIQHRKSLRLQHEASSAPAAEAVAAEGVALPCGGCPVKSQTFLLLFHTFWLGRFVRNEHGSHVALYSTTTDFHDVYRTKDARTKCSVRVPWLKVFPRKGLSHIIPCAWGMKILYVRSVPSVPQTSR